MCLASRSRDLTRSTEARYHASVLTVVLRPVLWEVTDIVEQIFRIACTENLHLRPEEYDASTCDYQAAHGLSGSAMREALWQYGTLTEIHERPQVITLMRVYGRRWRPWPAYEEALAAAQAREEGFAVTPDVTRTERRMRDSRISH